MQIAHRVRTATDATTPLDPRPRARAHCWLLARSAARARSAWTSRSDNGPRPWTWMDAARRRESRFPGLARGRYTRANQLRDKVRHGVTVNQSTLGGLALQLGDWYR
ncbi:hypothetical protein ABLO16_09830 [Mycobacterium tuberculosis]